MPSKNTIRMSAAGAGKTWGICHDALAVVASPLFTKRVLITTFTNKGVETIQSEIRKQNQGVLNPRIVIYSWYQFLLYELIRPYQTSIAEINEIKSFDFSDMFNKINYHAKGQKSRYITSRGNVRANEASELVLQLNAISNGRVIKRMEKVYSNVFVDEIQDMAGSDLDIISLLLESSIITVCVGDNKQATYRTHNTQRHKNQPGKNIWEYFSCACKSGKAEIENNLVSRRFNEQICHFANRLYSNENNITTVMRERTGHDGVFLILHDDVPYYYAVFSPVVMKYDKRTETDCFDSFNFGQCKGVTFERVLIYPNGPLSDYINTGKQLKSQQKYYVAVTRPKYSIAIVVDAFPTSDQFTYENIRCGDREIRAMRYICEEEK